MRYYNEQSMIRTVTRRSRDWLTANDLIDMSRVATCRATLRLMCLLRALEASSRSCDIV